MKLVMMEAVKLVRREGGCEAAMHAMTQIYYITECDAFILVDVRNAM